MLSPETLDLLRQWWKARPSRYDAGAPIAERWLFSGNRHGKPMTTRHLSRLFQPGGRRGRDQEGRGSRPSSWRRFDTEAEAMGMAASVQSHLWPCAPRKRDRGQGGLHCGRAFDIHAFDIVDRLRWARPRMGSAGDRRGRPARSAPPSLRPPYSGVAAVTRRFARAVPHRSGG